MGWWRQQLIQSWNRDILHTYKVNVSHLIIDQKRFISFLRIHIQSHFTLERDITAPIFKDALTIVKDMLSKTSQRKHTAPNLQGMNLTT